MSDPALDRQSSSLHGGESLEVIHEAVLDAFMENTHRRLVGEQRDRPRL